MKKEMESCDINGIRQLATIVKENNDNYYVSVNVPSACAGCAVKGGCSTGAGNSELIEVEKGPDENYKPGDEVTVILGKTMGTRAVMLGYIIPLIVLVGSLLIFNQLFAEDGITGLLALALLVVYYVILYFYREKLKKKFKIRIG